MKVCDKCEDKVRATNGLVTIIEDEHFDLCDTHFLQVTDFLRKKEKLTLSILGRKKKTA